MLQSVSLLPVAEDVHSHWHVASISTGFQHRFIIAQQCRRQCKQVSQFQHDTPLYKQIPHRMYSRSTRYLLYDQWRCSVRHVSDRWLPAAGFSGGMVDRGPCQWHFPPRCPRPRHTLLDGSLSFVSGSDAGPQERQIDAGAGNKRKMKWSTAAKVETDQKGVSGEMAQRLAAG